MLSNERPWNTKIPARLIDFEKKTLAVDNYCIGIKMLSSGGGSGTWVYIDEEENIVTLPVNYFEHHPVFSNITIGNMDGVQIMARIPKFYFRTDEGKKYWITPNPVTDGMSKTESIEALNDLKNRGFKVHPAFIKDNGEEVNFFYLGVYQASYDNGVCCSIQNVYPVKSSLSFNDYKESCNARNKIEGGISGFHMWSIFEMSAITLLAMIEGCTTDFQTRYGSGRVSSPSVGKTNDESVISASYHGITGLWGNAWQYVDKLFVNSDNFLVVEGFYTNEDGETVHREFSTEVKVPSKDSDRTIWINGKSSGYYSKLNMDKGQAYDFSELFIPDFNSLTDKYVNGTYSDYIFGRVVTNAKNAVCVGGDFSSGNKAGLFAYNFNIGIDEMYSNTTTRLAKH